MLFRVPHSTSISGKVAELTEHGPSLAGRLAGLAARCSIRPVLTVGSHLPKAPWPWGAVDYAARILPPCPGSVHHPIALRHCPARMVRAAGVRPPDGTGRVVLYLHGGAFLLCGLNTHDRMVTTLSGYADSPVLLVDYRMLPDHPLGTAIDDCYAGYRWLRDQGYRPEQIVVAGDSAGGFLALSLAQRLRNDDDEQPAAVVCMSPLTQITPHPRRRHRNARTDAMFPVRAFDALAELIADAARRHAVNGVPEQIYEPLEHIEPGLCRTLIHVSGSEALLHDAQEVTRRLAEAGVQVQLRVWPGQMHAFQVAAPLVPEATRSLRQIGRYIRDVTDWTMRSSDFDVDDLELSQA